MGQGLRKKNSTIVVASLLAIGFAGGALFLPARVDNADSEKGTRQNIESPAIAKDGDNETSVVDLEPGSNEASELPTKNDQVSDLAVAEEQSKAVSAEELIENLRRERDPDTVIALWQQLRLIEGVMQRPEVAQLGAELIKSGVNECRHVGYSLLSVTSAMSPSLVDEVEALAADAEDPLVRIAALSVFADWMDKHENQRGRILGSALEIASSDEDDRVRGAAIQMLALDSFEPTDETVATVSRLLIAEKNATNRRLAALGVGKVEVEAWKPFLLGQLQEAYMAESDAKVKQELLRSLMKLDGDEGRAFIGDLVPETDPDLVADIHGYLDLESGGAGE